jgi:LysM repeat protein
MFRKAPEVWSIKTSGNQIWINRLDQNGEGNVTLNVATPLKSRGEQTFSSFADVKRYIDTITTPEPLQDQANNTPQLKQAGEDPPTVVTSSIAKPAAAPKRTEQPEKTNAGKQAQLNAGLKKAEIKTAKKVVVQSSSSPGSAAAPKKDPRLSAKQVVAATQVTVGAGDTLNGLARRYKTSSAEIRKLNPQINDQGVIKPDQKLRVPSAAPSKDPKGRKLALLKQAH